MIKKSAGLLFFMVLLYSCRTARVPTGSYVSTTRSEYIEKYKDLAVEEMHRTGVPASITMAQALLESGDGNSYLARKTNNHFGIKCHSDWKGKTFRYDDDRRRECFRKYNKVEDSYHDHSDFLRNGSRYASLFELNPSDYKSWARGLKKAGYATHPHYSQLLIGIIEDNHLYDLDRETTVATYKPPVSPQAKPDANESIAQNKQISANSSGEEFIISSGKRKTGVLNRITYVMVKPGDTFSSLAAELDVMKWELPKYNDLSPDAQLEAGMILFLQPKRNQAEQGNNTYIFQEGDTLWKVSQKFGIKLAKLYELNSLKKDQQPAPGTKLQLRNKRK